jgi:hypothetical protein
MEHKLCCKEMVVVVQCEESHLAMEIEAFLCCEEMGLWHKENRVQHIMMSVMLISMIQNNSAMSGMIASIGGIDASTGVPPEQENVNLAQSANGDAANGDAN